MNSPEYEPQPDNAQFKEVLDIFSRGILASKLKNPPTALRDDGVATEVLIRDDFGSRYVQMQCLNSQLRRDDVTMVRIDTASDELFSTDSRSFVFFVDNTCVELRKTNHTTEHRRLDVVEQKALVRHIISVSYQDYSF